MPSKDRETRNVYQRAYRLKRGMKPRVPSPRVDCFGRGIPLGPRGVNYCSTRCQSATEYRMYIRRWLAGEEKGGPVAFVWKYVRRYRLEQGGEQCPRCGWNERHSLTGRVPLEIDHLNGNYEGNRPESVRLLCSKRHALTPTFRGLNGGNGRPWTKVRRQLEP